MKSQKWRRTNIVPSSLSSGPVQTFERQIRADVWAAKGLRRASFFKGLPQLAGGGAGRRGPRGVPVQTFFVSVGQTFGIMAPVQTFGGLRRGACLYGSDVCTGPLFGGGCSRNQSCGCLYGSAGAPLLRRGRPVQTFPATLFSEEAPPPAPPLEEGPISEIPKQKTGTERLTRTNIFRHWSRTNICSPGRPVQTFAESRGPNISAVQTSAAGKCFPLLAAARAPPDVWTANVCTGLPLAEEGRCRDREMFVRVGCTRPVQTSAHKSGAPDPYKHPDKFRGPNIWPKSLPVQTSRSKPFSTNCF